MTDDKPAGVHYPACNDKCVHCLEGDESVREIRFPRVPQREPVGSLPGQGAVTDSSAEPAASGRTYDPMLAHPEWQTAAGGDVDWTCPECGHEAEAHIEGSCRYVYNSDLREQCECDWHRGKRL